MKEMEYTTSFTYREIEFLDEGNLIFGWKCG